MSKEKEKRCVYCGRLQSQVAKLTKRGLNHICNECERLFGSMYGNADIDITPQTRDPVIADDYRRHHVEKAVQSELRQQFSVAAEEPKDPADKERLRNMAGNEMGAGMMAHPVLAKEIQFNGINDINQLPTMDPEQQEKYLDLQLALQHQKQLQARHEADIAPRQP